MMVRVADGSEVVKPALEGGVVAELVDQLLEALLVHRLAVCVHPHHVALALVVLFLKRADDALKVLAPLAVVDLVLFYVPAARAARGGPRRQAPPPPPPRASRAPAFEMVEARTPFRRARG